ncbi:MAG: AAA family ATPase [Paracoccaceae bacterium]
MISKIKRLLKRQPPFHVQAQAMPEETLRAIVTSELRRGLTASQIGVSYAISIQFASTDPRLAAQIANAIANQYLDNLIGAKEEATDRVNQWMSQRIADLGQQVEAAEQAVVEFRNKMNDEAGGGIETTNQLLAELNSRLVTTSAERADAEVRYRLVERLMATDGGLAAVADVVTSPLLETLNRQKSELAQSQAELASTLGPKHPDMVKISAQIADLDRSIEAELRRRIEAMRSDVVVTQNREEALKEQIEEVSQRAEQLASASVRLDQLERTAAATRAVYENFLARFKETSQRSDYQMPEARLISEAEIPIVPSEPRKLLSLTVATVFGVFAGVAFVFFRSVIAAPIRTSTELREASGLPNLALLPFVPQQGRGNETLIEEITGTAASPLMEGVINLRMRIFDNSQGKVPKSLAVTSSRAGEGKSTVCFLLARSLSSIGKSVVILDADLRRSDTLTALGLDRSGLCLVDYLEGRGNQKDLFHHSEMLGADVVLPHRKINHAAELLAGPKASGLISRLSSRYDVIIINCPPVLNLSDAVVLSRYADTTLLVVESGKTPVKMLRDILHRLHEAQIPIIGTAMTKVQQNDVAAREIYGYSY